MGGILQTSFGSLQAIKDASFKSTVCLLKTTSTNGANTNSFLDSSTNNFPITTAGNPTQGAFSPFSPTGWSAYFTGTSYVSVPANSNYDITDGDFTIEFWVNWKKGNGQASAGMTYFGNFQSSVGWYVSSTSNGFGAVQSMDFGIYNAGFTTASNSAFDYVKMPAGTWNHVAIVRSGSGAGNLKFYLNGVNIGGSYNAPTYPGAGGQLAFGVYQQNLQYAGDPNMYLSNVRILKGRALYTSDFIPSTSPLTAIDNTVFLGFQNNRFLDNSSLNATFSTGTAGTIIQAFSPFAPSIPYSPGTHGGSGYFNGSGEYISTAHNTALELNGVPFCIEAWVYLTSISTANQLIIGKRDTNGGTSYAMSYYIVAQSGGVVTFGSYGAGGTNNISLSSAGGVLKAYAWNHVAVTGDGTNIAVYANGSRVISPITATLNTSTSSVYLGNYPVDNPALLGYIAGARIVKGSQIYSGATYTIPTAPLAAVANTSLLLNFTNSGIYDATAKNDLRIVGNPRASNIQAKFGDTAIFFDGISDYIDIPNGPTAVFGTRYGGGSGAWVVDFWIYPVATARQCFIDTRSSVASTTGLTIYSNPTSRTLGLQTGTTIVCTSPTSANLTTNAWNYVSVISSGTTATIFLNGSNVASGAYAETLSDQFLRIGATCQAADSINGYLDEFRITKGITRANTTPTLAFPSL